MAAQFCHSGVDEGRAKAGAAMGFQHADAADLADIARDQQAGGADGGAGVGGQKMDGGVVLVVDLIRLWHALFFDEHDAAEGAAGGDVAGGLDLHGHAK